MRHALTACTNVTQGVLRVVALLTVLLVAPGSAKAAPGQVTEFQAPKFLHGLVMGSDGNLWSAESQGIARFSPGGQLTEFKPPALAYNVGTIAAGPDGAIWYVVGAQTEPKHIGRITPGGQISEFPISGPGTYLSGMTSGNEGNLWVTEAETAQIFRIAPPDHVTSFSLPQAPHGWPTAITLGPEGNLWFTGSNEVGRLTPGGEITEFPLPTPYNVPRSIALGPDGNLWFAGDNKGTVGRVTPTGQITEFALDPKLRYNRPEHITAGPDGNLWFTKAEARRQVDRRVPYQPPPGLTEGEIGRITPNGQITEFRIPSRAPTGAITVGPDGDLWFTERGPKLGRIEPGLLGVQLTETEAAVGADRVPIGLACGGGAPGEICRGTVRLSIAASVARRHNQDATAFVGLGHVRYRLATERRTHMQVSLNRRGRRMLAHRRTLRVLESATLRGGNFVRRELTLHPSTSGRFKRGHCGPAKGATLLAEPKARIYGVGSNPLEPQEPERIYGCLVSTGHSITLSPLPMTSGWRRPTMYSPFALAAPWAAGAVFQTKGRDSHSHSVTARNLRSGQLKSCYVGSGHSPRSSGRVTSIALKRNGSFAWAGHGRVGAVTGQFPPREVVACDSKGERLLDSGSGIDLHSLSLHGSELTWTDAGEAQSATLF
jgi:streptogramin lyase